MTILVTEETTDKCLFSYKSDQIPRIGDHLTVRPDKSYLVLQVNHDVTEDDEGKTCYLVEVLVR